MDDPAPDHHGDEKRGRDGEIHDGCADGRERHGEAWKVDLRDQAFRVDKAVPGIGHGGGEERPGKHSGVDEDRVTRRRDVGHAAEENGEDDHHHGRLQDGPGGAEDRLLVPDLDVAPDQESTAVP